MTTSTRTRRVNSPAYYLGRPAALAGRVRAAAGPSHVGFVHQRGARPGRGPRLRWNPQTGWYVSAGLRMSFARAAVMLRQHDDYYRAWENQAFVR